MLVFCTRERAYAAEFGRRDLAETDNKGFQDREVCWILGTERGRGGGVQIAGKRIQEKEIPRSSYTEMARGDMGLSAGATPFHETATVKENRPAAEFIHHWSGRPCAHYLGGGHVYET